MLAKIDTTLRIIMVLAIITISHPVGAQTEPPANPFGLAPPTGPIANAPIPSLVDFTGTFTAKGANEDFELVIKADGDDKVTGNLRQGAATPWYVEGALRADGKIIGSVALYQGGLILYFYRLSRDGNQLLFDSFKAEGQEALFDAMKTNADRDRDVQKWGHLQFLAVRPSPEAATPSNPLPSTQSELPADLRPAPPVGSPAVPPVSVPSTSSKFVGSFKGNGNIFDCWADGDSLMGVLIFDGRIRKFEASGNGKTLNGYSPEQGGLRFVAEIKGDKLLVEIEASDWFLAYSRPYVLARQVVSPKAFNTTLATKSELIQKHKELETSLFSLKARQDAAERQYRQQHDTILTQEWRQYPTYQVYGSIKQMENGSLVIYGKSQGVNLPSQEWKMAGSVPYNRDLLITNYDPKGVTGVNGDYFRYECRFVGLSRGVYVFSRLDRGILALRAKRSQLNDQYNTQRKMLQSEINSKLIELEKVKSALKATGYVPPPPSVRVKDIVVGKGKVAAVGLVATIKYLVARPNVRMSNGKTADVVMESREAVALELTNSPFDAGIVGMRVGGVRRIEMPPGTSYRMDGFTYSRPINETLIFQATLLRVDEYTGTHPLTSRYSYAVF